MGWLAPTTGLLAAAVAVPLLVLLYFLKMKRRDRPISSTLLWKRAVQDLQVNAPFQRLRWNVLLLLQFLALAAALVALARPVLSLTGGPARRVVLMMDNSASMRATDVAPSRLDEARRQAGLVVDSLRGKRSWTFADESDQAMVLAFGPAVKVMSNYTSDKAQLRAALEAIEPTDGESRLAEAMAVAQAFATPAGAEDKGRSAAAPADMALFTDGRIADLDQAVAPPGTLAYHRIGTEGANVGVVAMQARRSFERPDEVTVFANLANYGAEAVTADVQLAIDGRVRAVKAATVPPREPARAAEAGRPGRVAVAFVLAHAESGVLEVRIVHEDALSADNAAWAVLEPPRTLRVALVTAGNEPLAAALGACPLARLDVLAPAAFDQAYGGETAPDPPYGLIVLDRHSPPRLPRANYLVFGSPPAASGVREVGRLKRQAIIDWQDKHPVLNFVNLESIYAAECGRLDAPRDAVVLAEFGDTPALVLSRRGGSLFLIAGFDTLQTNWPFDAGFAMFCYNVIHYIGTEAGEAAAEGLRPGQALAVQAPPGRREAVVTAPDGRRETVAADASGLVRYPRTWRAGVYRVAVAGGPEARFAVNLLDDREGDIAPADALACTGQVVRAEEAEPAPANREVWPLLVALALALVLLEWYVYTSKVRL